MHVSLSSRMLDLTTPVVMGVLNLTPDSFSDAGRFQSEKAATKAALHMVEAGASIIDIGGESTRPGSSQALILSHLGLECLHLLLSQDG